MGRRKRRLGIPDEDLQAHCVNCDALLNTENGVLASPDWYGSTRFVHYCKECQKAQFEDYIDQFGADMAFVVCCAAYNLPFIPEAVPSRREADGANWEAYLEQLKLLDQDVTDSGEPAAFSDGMTDLSVMFDGKVPARPMFAGGLTTGGVAEKLEGTRAQRKNWGLSYKTAEYKELDRLYGIRTTRFKDGGIDLMLEYTLRELCKLQLAFSQAMGSGTGGDSKKAKEIMSMITSMESSNLLRPKDEAPAAAKQIDTLISCLERKGMARNGKLLAYDELLKVLQKDHPHYPMGHDMLDQIIGCIWNNIRINDGAGETAELPVGLQVDPMFGELEEGTSAKEEKLLRDLQDRGMTLVKREKREPDGSR